jgi:hypothetical protein
MHYRNYPQEAKSSVFKGGKGSIIVRETLRETPFRMGSFKELAGHKADEETDYKRSVLMFRPLCLIVFDLYLKQLKWVLA